MNPNTSTSSSNTTTGPGPLIIINNSSSEATATYEFIIELHKFYNVDLFLRGSYQIQVQLKVNTKLNSKIEVSVNRNGNSTSNSHNSKKHHYSNSNTTGPHHHHHNHHSNHLNPSNQPTPHQIISQPTSATSKKFHILFKSEEIELNQVVLFRTFIYLDSCKNLSELSKIEFKLELKLLFNDLIVSKRELEFNLNNYIISYYRPVFFDYFHLSAVGIGVHGGCIAVHLVKGLASLDLTTSCSASATSSPTSCVSSNNSYNINSKLTRTHNQLIKILLESNSCLKDKMAIATTSSNNENSLLLPTKKIINNSKSSSCNFESMTTGAAGAGADSEEILIQASKQMSQLCAENILTWHKFLDSIIGKENVRKKLANEHHLERVRRWTEGFYITKNPIRNLLTPKDYNPIAELLKKSINYKPLALHCFELDGDNNSIPIIFEDQYGNGLLTSNIEPNNTCNCDCKFDKKKNKELNNDMNSSTLISAGSSTGTCTNIESTNKNAHVKLTTVNETKQQIKQRKQSITSGKMILLNKEIIFENNTTTDIDTTVTPPPPIEFSNVTTLNYDNLNCTLPRKTNKTKNKSNNNIKNTNKKSSNNIRKYSSTPTLFNEDYNNDSISSNSTNTSEESGWVSDQSEDNVSLLLDESNTTELVLPPPVMFRDNPINQQQICLDSVLFNELNCCPGDRILNSNSTTRKFKYGSIQEKKKKLRNTYDGDDQDLEFLNAQQKPGPSSSSIVTTRQIINRRSSHPPEQQQIIQSNSSTTHPALQLKSHQLNAYFQIPDELRIFSIDGLHLIICVHGLDGSCHDLRLFKIYLELNCPSSNLHFLMSEKNQDGLTFTDFSSTTDSFINEILNYIEIHKLNPSRISFVGHSLGNIIIRSAITKPKLKHLLPKLYTFLSLSGPHLGTVYNGTVVNVGMWLMQKWKKSTSLLQLSLKDHSDLKETFIYKLSLNSNLNYFKYLLLCGSSQDRYVPLHSAHILNCKASLRDQSQMGPIYRSMINNLLYPLIKANTTKIIRYDIHHAINNTSANSIIGRTAHIAVLDSEIFIEKFIAVSGRKYFG